MGSCYGEYWDGTADSECREGEGCAKINECLAAFATGTLAKHQKELGPKKATPDELAKLTSVRPEAILLAINFQHNTEFNPYEGMEEKPKREPAREKEPEAKQEPEEPKQEVKGKKVKEEKEDAEGGAASGNQFCEKCRGTGRRGRGACRACKGTGRAKVDVGAKVSKPVEERAEIEPASSETPSGDDVDKSMEGGETPSDGAGGVLPVQEAEVSDAVLDSGTDNEAQLVARADEPRHGKTVSQQTTFSDNERPKVFPPTLPTGQPQGNGTKKQVVVDMYNKRTVAVTWPGYPTLMETPSEKIVQIIAWDTTRQGWVRLVPQLSGDPDELLYSSLFQG